MENTGERWVVVPRYNGKIEISDRAVIRRTGVEPKIYPHIVSTGGESLIPETKRPPMVKLKGEPVYVFELMAESFFEDYQPNRFRVVYKDRSPGNLNLANLKIEPLDYFKSAA